MSIMVAFSLHNGYLSEQLRRHCQARELLVRQAERAQNMFPRSTL